MGSLNLPAQSCAFFNGSISYICISRSLLGSWFSHCFGIYDPKCFVVTGSQRVFLREELHDINPFIHF